MLKSSSRRVPLKSLEVLCVLV
jgi:hypothetical protein